MRRAGFTIVELLIVIVVIAILAAITIVAFNGIQQRAKTTAKVSTVQQAVKLILLYKAAQGNYPRSQSDGTYCLTADNACTSYNGTVHVGPNAALMNDLREFGTLPAHAGDTVGSGPYGVQYMYVAARTLDEVSSPVLIMFFLDGIDRSCEGLIVGMVSVTNGAQPNDFVPSVRSSGNVASSSGKTRCYMMFPG